MGHFSKAYPDQFSRAPKHEYVNKLHDSWAIPQNWLVDGAGKWRWVQIGYDSAEPDWVNSMIQRIQDLKNRDKDE